MEGYPWFDLPVPVFNREYLACAIPYRRVYLSDVAMALTCGPVSADLVQDPRVFLDRAREDIDFLEAIDGCTK